MIRLLEQNDIKRCVEICDSNFNNLGYSYDAEKDFLSQFSNNINQLHFFVFEDDGIVKGVAGFANCWFDSSVFGLCTCYVDPLFHFNGIGKSLTLHRIQEIRKIGGEVIFSTTKSPWHLSRFGFVEIDSPYKDWKLMQLILR